MIKDTTMTHAMLINAGVRPVALVMVRNEHIEENKKLIKTEKLFAVLNSRGENHTAIYIFKHPCVENIINFTLDKPYNKKALMQWIEGKMFGYSDEEIVRFINLERQRKNNNIRRNDGIYEI